MKYPYALERIIRSLSKLPGVGRRTAERYAFDLFLHWKEAEVQEFGSALTALKKEVGTCPVCHCITDHNRCLICLDESRQKTLLCIVSTPREVFTIENTKEFNGVYHVLGGLLSPLDGIGEDELNLAALKKRVADEGIQEVILALDSTLEGDTTALYLKNELDSMNIKVFRLAFGIPVGSSLEYVDGGSLARALTGKAVF